MSALWLAGFWMISTVWAQDVPVVPSPPTASEQPSETEVAPSKVDIEGVEVPTLLPPLRDGWRFERLDLPLEFAPELEYRGFEELQFAPGMFDPTSPTFFTYAFAVQFDDPVVMDEAFLRRFLTAYYTGLCRSVASDRGVDVDLSQIKVRVVGRNRGADGTGMYYLRVGFIEPFVTTRFYTLQMELKVVPGLPARMYALVSPMRKGEDAWMELYTLWDAISLD